MSLRAARRLKIGLSSGTPASTAFSVGALRMPVPGRGAIGLPTHADIAPGDWIALTGDTADNIPGVPGIGGKTAARILEQCPSLDRLWDALDTLVLTPRIKSLLRDHRAVVERNRVLTPLRTDLPLPSEWTLWTCRPTPPRAIPWLESMEFHSLARAQQQPELF